MTRKTDARGILWEGQSPLNGEPIVAIATGSENVKTGPMVQVWILHRDVSPLDAIRSGQDKAICGFCPMRGKGFEGRACYVNIGTSPATVWKTYKAGRYEDLRHPAHRLAAALLAGHCVRWGAYGDPAVLPPTLVGAVNAGAALHTGYTHQWHHNWAQWCKGVFMASVETAAQEDALRAKGWGTFRAGLPDGSDIGQAVLCQYERNGATCLECGACDGRSTAIYIPSHGSGKNYVPAARLAKRKVTA